MKAIDWIVGNLNQHNNLFAVSEMNPFVNGG